MKKNSILYFLEIHDIFYRKIWHVSNKSMGNITDVSGKSDNLVQQ